MKVKEEIITPAKAEQILRNNIKNRGISTVNLQRLMDQMKDGEWQENTGEAIKIAKDNTLLDGQHRLTAVVRTGMTFKFLVIYDLPNKAFNVIDTGKTRNASDSLRIMGVKNNNDIAGIIRKYLFLDSGRAYNKSSDNKAASNTKIVKAYEEEPENWYKTFSKATVLYIQCKRFLSKSMIGSWYKYLNETEPEQCDVFFNKLCSGLGMTDQRDPIYVLRQMLIENMASDKKMTQFAMNAYFVTTWNSFLQDKKYNNIPWRYGRDEMPMPFKTRKKALEALL